MSSNLNDKLTAQLIKVAITTGSVGELKTYSYPSGINRNNAIIFDLSVAYNNDSQTSGAAMMSSYGTNVDLGLSGYSIIINNSLLANMTAYVYFLKIV